MGLLDDYAIDMSDVPDAPSYDIADDFYEFVVGDLFIREGTTSKPNSVWVIIDYALGEEGKSKQEWFELPADSAAPTEKEIQRLSFLKRRLVDLGATEEQIADLDPADFIGKSGSLEVYTNKGYQNIKNIVLEGADEAEPEADEVIEGDPATDKAAKPVVRKAAPSAAARKEAAAPAKAAAVGVKKNPFAK